MQIYVRQRTGLCVLFNEGTGLSKRMVMELPFGNLTWLWNITISKGKTHYKWQFSIAMLNYQRVTRMLGYWCYGEYPRKYDNCPTKNYDFPIKYDVPRKKKYDLTQKHDLPNNAMLFLIKIEISAVNLAMCPTTKCDFLAKSVDLLSKHNQFPTKLLISQ